MKTFSNIIKFNFRENNDDTIVPRIKIVCWKNEIILQGTTDIALKVIKNKYTNPIP